MFKLLPTPLLRQCAVVITADLMALCAGINNGWSSPVLVKLRDPTQTPFSRPITDDEGGWIVSIGFIFSLFTLPCTGFIVDWIGRKHCFFMICLPKIAAGVMTIFATDVWCLLVARVIVGITSTSAFFLIVIYSTEISSKENRGSLGLLMPIFSNLGVLLMLGIGPYISYINLSILITVIPICACIPLLWIPDTPYFLYNNGKIEDAKKVLLFLRGSQALVEEELKELSERKPNEKLRLKEIFKNKTYIKSLIIVVVLGIGVQLVGFNFISFYLQTILEISNTSVSPAMGSVIIGVIQLLTSIAATAFIDRFGRKPILIATLLAMALGMIGLGIFFLLKHYDVFISGFLNYLPLISIAIVTFSFSGGIGSIYFVVVAEILDGPIRAVGSAISSELANCMVFLLSRFTLNILSAMGPDITFIVFGVISILMALFVIFIVPETKQKTIAEIQRALAGLKENVERKDRISRF